MGHLQMPPIDFRFTRPLLTIANLFCSSYGRLRGRAPGALFCPVNKAGKIGATRMSTQAVYKMLQKRGAEAGLRKIREIFPELGLGM